MKELADILKSTSVTALINSKPMRKKNFIFLHIHDNIRTALITFTIHEIDSIPLRETADENSEFIGIISIVNLLKFIFSTKTDISVPDLLNLELIHVTKDAELIQAIEYVSAESSLINLLLNVWGRSCNPNTNEIDCRHLLTINQSGKYDVITPLDFLRHILFLNSKAIACIKDLPASEIENGFDVDQNFTVRWGEDAKVAMHRMIGSSPNYLVAIVNEETGSIEANITFTDLLPSDSSLLDVAISIMHREGISIQAYLQTLNSLHCPNNSIDPILLHPHFSVYDLIEKLTRLHVHHLWRVTPDSKKRPIGAVGTTDVLRYLSFMFRPFMQIDKASNDNENCPLGSCQ